MSTLTKIKAASDVPSGASTAQQIEAAFNAVVEYLEQPYEIVKDAWLKHDAVLAQMPEYWLFAYDPQGTKTKLFWKRCNGQTIDTLTILPVTAGSGAAFTLTMNNKPLVNEIFLVKFNRAAVATSTLSINSETAKQIRVNDAVTTTSSWVANALCMLYYDGTYYHIVR